MANGDLGSLWFNLGIKDTTGVTLNRILKAVHDAEGSVSKLRLSYQALFDSIKKQEEKDAFAKNWEPGIKNAMKYFEMLMRIDNEQKRLSAAAQFVQSVYYIFVHTLLV